MNSKTASDDGTNRKALGEAIRESLSTHGRTVTSLAVELGIQRPTLANWIRRNTFPEEQLTRLAEAVKLGIPKGELEQTFAYATAGWTWAGAGKPRRTQGSTNRLGGASTVSYLDWIGSLEAGQWLVKTVPDGVPEEWREMIAGSAEAPVSDALRASLERGAGILYFLPSVTEAEAWEKQFGVGPAPNAESLLNSWVRRSTLSEGAAARIRLRRASGTPLFSAGIAVTAQLEPDVANGWRLVRGVLELGTLQAGRPALIREEGIPPVMARVLLQLVGRELR